MGALSREISLHGLAQEEVSIFLVVIVLYKTVYLKIILLLAKFLMVAAAEYIVPPAHQQ